MYIQVSQLSNVQLTHARRNATWPTCQIQKLRMREKQWCVRKIVHVRGYMKRSPWLV